MSGSMKNRPLPIKRKLNVQEFTSVLIHIPPRLTAAFSVGGEYGGRGATGSVRAANRANVTQVPRTERMIVLLDRPIPKEDNSREVGVRPCQYGE